MYQILLNAIRETVFMVAAASFISLTVGIPLGIFVASISKSKYKMIKSIYFTFVGIMQTAQMIPFLLLMLLFIPMTNWLINQQVAYTAATIIPMATAGTLILATKINEIMLNLYKKWDSTIKNFGASNKQSILLILLPEALPQIIKQSTATCALLVGFSVIAGALGAGGLGQLAIEKSLHDANPTLVLLSILTLLALQQFIKYTGTLIAQQAQPG